MINMSVTYIDYDGVEKTENHYFKMAKEPEKIQYDKATDEWFKHHPGAQTTVARCDKCGLYFKPSIGHKC